MTEEVHLRIASEDDIKRHLIIVLPRCFRFLARPLRYTTPEAAQRSFWLYGVRPNGAIVLSPLGILNTLLRYVRVTVSVVWP